MNKDSDKSKEIHNKLALVRVGLFPPNIERQEMQEHFIWKLWDTFRDYCRFAKIEQNNGFTIFCREKKQKSNCTFSDCPALAKAISKYSSKKARKD